MADYEEKESAGKEESDEDILEDARKYLKQCVNDEDPERTKMKDDLRFCTLDQWPDDIRQERENDEENGPRPCLTIDKINQYIVQIVNDMRQGKPGIVVRPQDDQADVQTAKILKGLIRNIEDQSSADIAYSTAAENAVKIGLGYFRITTEYVSEDSFDQEIFIRSIPNTFSVYLGKHIMPDGSDAECGFVVEAMAIEKFKAEYPKADYKADSFEDLEDAEYWKTDDTITVVEEYCFKRVPQELLFLADGTTMTRADYDKWPAEAGPQPAIQQTRKTFKKQLKWRKLTGVEVLDKRDLPGKYIPIVEVVGREAQIEGKRILWGLVRPAKDSLRMYNYFASTITEKMALAPKTPFIVAKGQLAGVEDRWKKANRVNYSYLEYDPVSADNGNALPAPQRVGPAPMEAALLHQMQVIEHDVQTSLGMFKAATGESESQQSGRAILALQKESDTGTYHFGANQGISIRHGGRIILDLIPHYYDTKRIIRIIGEDGEVQTAHIDPSQTVAHRKIEAPDGIKNIYNPGLGKYDISLTVGPSYNTKRMEAAATFVEMSKGAADPASAAVLRYLVMKNSDAAGADEAAKLLKTLLPPQALQALANNEPIPPQVQAQMQQMQQKMQQMQEAGAKLQQENTQLKSGAQEAQSKIAAHSQEAQAKLQVHAQEKQAELQLSAATAQQEMAMERERAAHEIALEREKAAAALHLEHEKEKASQETELRKAALQAATQIEVARINSTKDAAAGVAPVEGAQAGDIMKQILATQQQLLEKHAAPKRISMTLPDGRQASATVQ